MSLKVLDCTLRDGGYYNNWDFPQELVNAYLHSVSAAGIDMIEIGFRSQPQDGYNGAYAYSTDSFLEKQSVPEGIRLGVMINAKDILRHPTGAAAYIDRMFDKACNSPVTFVRLAAQIQEIEGCAPAMRRLKELGYMLTINFLRTGGTNIDSLINASRKVRLWGAVDVLYFADSLGNMDPEQVKETITGLRSEWPGDIGIHTHNNKGQAVANTLSAVESGATWVDGTIYGMGRGAGNAQTEYILIEFNKRGLGNYHADALFPLVLNEFEALHKTYKWGPKLLYYLSGAYNIHPSYAQEILRDGTYSSEHVIEAMQALREGNSDAYTVELLHASMSQKNIAFPGTWSAAGWARDRPVLVVGAGPWVREHVDSLLSFINKTNSVVICLNTNVPLPQDKISAFVACSPFRFAIEANHYLNLKAPLIATIAALPKQVREKLKPDQTFNYGMTVEVDRFSAEETGCVIPRRLAAAYALALANSAGARCIYLAGFDGYSVESPLQKEMEYVFQCYKAMPGAIPITAVTPTTYSVPRSSIFAPVI